MRILVLCTGNSARSQMAEGLLTALFPGVDARSAGTRPAERVHPRAIEAMREIGIDISAHQPKAADQFTNQAFDLVLTVCSNAEHDCPVFQGKVRRRVHLPFDDPAASGDLAEFRRVRDEIRVRLTEVAPTLRSAQPGDLNAVLTLLRSQKLPTDGVADGFGDAYVIAELAGALAGVAGVERYGEHGLLRSVATSDSARGIGLGELLVNDRIHWAREQGLRELWLLTTTAAQWFPRFGFEQVARDQAPPEIRKSYEYSVLCPSGSALMRLSLLRVGI